MVFFLLISCGGGSGNTSIKDNSTDLNENSIQDSNSETSRINESISINNSITISGEDCPTLGGAITFSANIEGSSRTSSLRNFAVGMGGSKTLRLSTMGVAERFDANQNNIEVISTLRALMIRTINLGK